MPRTTDIVPDFLHFLPLLAFPFCVSAQGLRLLLIVEQSQVIKIVELSTVSPAVKWNPKSPLWHISHSIIKTKKANATRHNYVINAELQGIVFRI